MSVRNDTILLESGTNELEIIMFSLANRIFSLNVLKTREIITPLPITEIPNSHEYVEGVISLRDEVIPVVNLGIVLNIPPAQESEKDKFIIVELNQIKIAIRVNDVQRIARISWEQIEKPHDLSAGKQPYATGIIKMDDDMSILLDLEKIVVEINPEMAGDVGSIKELGTRERSVKKIVVAEDSAVLRKLLQDTLAEAGYDNAKFFQNGKDAWDYLETLTNDPNVTPKDEVHLILTDIEMPQMDGHHLTHRTKNHALLKDIPVVIFSSLITEELFHKGERVGASAQVSKPKLVDLVKEIDKYIL